MKRIIETLSMLAVLLFVTACSSDIYQEIQPESDTVKIPFTATVNTITSTRATLNSDKQYIFEAGDKLYVEGTGVYGVLTLKDGEEDKRTGAVFEGDLNCTGSPATDLALTATLVSSIDALHTISGDKVTATAYTTAIAATEAEAIQKFSHFTGSATYGNPSFSLSQQSAFISFDITLKDGTDTNIDLAVSISNGGDAVRTGTTTTTVVSSEVKARFVAAFPGGSTTLDNASVTLGTKPAISFGGSTALAKNNIYTVTKGLIDISTLTDSYEAKNGDMLYGVHNAGNISIADGATVTIKDATINKSSSAAGIACVGDATINIEGTNNVKGNTYDYPGIYIPEDKTLIIQGSGSLTATTGGGEEKYAAGIGGSNTLDCGNIVIKGGIITANGGISQAGIGGGGKSNGPGSGHSCGYIRIEGGIIIANGGTYGSGIGSGENGTCGSITITSGVTQIKATAPYTKYIGAGSGGTCGTITIDNVPDATTESTFTNLTSSVSGNTWTLTTKSPAASKTLNTVSTNEVGWRIGSDGVAYSPIGTLPTGVSAVAMITYVGGANGEEAPYNHGLALAMSNANDGSSCKWSTSNSDAGHTYKPADSNFTSESGLQYNKTHNSSTYPAFQYAIANNGTAAPTGCSTWFLPTGYQWKLMINACKNVLGSNNDHRDLRDGFSNVGGTNMPPYVHWSSTEKDNTTYAWRHGFGDSDGNWDGGTKNVGNYVRSALAF